MNLKELEGIYKTACEAKGYVGNKGQSKVWFQTLGHLEEADLAQAVTRYFEANASFPMPAELKPLAEQARRARVNTGLGWIVTSICPECGSRYTGVYKTQERPVKTCRSPYSRVNGKFVMLGENEVCGAMLNILEDRREEMIKNMGGQA